MRIWVSLFVCVATLAAMPANSINYDATRPIYDDTAIKRSVDQLPQVLTDAYAKNKPVLFYVHGRGDEPTKSFSAGMTGGGALPRLEKEYGVTVVMVNWSSKGKSRLDRATPLGKMPEAVATFDATMSTLAAFRASHPDVAAPSLLVHSMGAIVVAKAIEAHGWRGTAEAPLFQHVLLSEADADSQGHDVWLSKLAAVERVYVTQNSDDFVLKHSTDQRSPSTNRALGLKPVAPLVARATYVDLTGALKKKLIVGAHQIFAKAWMGGNVGTCMFVSNVLRGQRFEILALSQVKLVSGSRYKIQRDVNKAHQCFADVDANAGDDE